MSLKPAAWRESAAVRPPIPAPAIKILGCELKYGILKDGTCTRCVVAIEVKKGQSAVVVTVLRSESRQGRVHHSQVPRYFAAAQTSLSKHRHIAGRKGLPRFMSVDRPVCYLWDIALGSLWILGE